MPIPPQHIAARALFPILCPIFGKANSREFPQKNINAKVRGSRQSTATTLPHMCVYWYVCIYM
jgi:hypothetical protein